MGPRSGRFAYPDATVPESDATYDDDFETRTVTMPDTSLVAESTATLLTQSELWCSLKGGWQRR